MANPERLVYIDGRLVPESEATVSVFDIGRLYGVTLYESVRTFRHEFFRLAEHLQRLECSLAYAGLGGAVARERIVEAFERVLQANVHLTDTDDDLWICVEVTPGLGFPMPLAGNHRSEPTVIAYTSELPHESYARSYTEGTHAVTSPFRNIPPQCFEQRCKNRSRFPHYLSKLTAQHVDADAFGLLLDIDGFLTEGTGANIFLVHKGTLLTPTTRNILDGISRQTVIELADRLGIPVVEKDLTLYDAYTAEEAFWTTTSYCILPISRIDDRPIGQAYPGPRAKALLDAWSAMIGVDIVAQAQRFAAGRLTGQSGPP